MTTAKVFVVSADVAVSNAAREVAESAGLEVEVFGSLREFGEAVQAECRGCLVVDAEGCGIGDPEVQAALAAAFARMHGLLLAGRGDIPTAVRAIKAGAMNVLQKPFRNEKLLESVTAVLKADATFHC